MILSCGSGWREHSLLCISNDTERRTSDKFWFNTKAFYLSEFCENIPGNTSLDLLMTLREMPDKLAVIKIISVKYGVMSKGQFNIYGQVGNFTLESQEYIF